MKNRWILFSSSLLSFMHPVAAAAANGGLGLATHLSLQDYFLIFIGGIIVLNLVIILWRSILRRSPQKEHSRLVTAVGSFLAIFFIGMGSLAAFIAVIVFLSAAFELSLFTWMLEILVYYSGSPVIGILGLGIIGVALFLLGAYNLFLLQNSPFWKSLEAPHSTGSPEKKVMSPEDWSPMLRIRVMVKSSMLPAGNKRVILRDEAGKKFFTRYTNSEGEVVFDSLKGHLSDYYAYVDGDERREAYSLVRMDSPK